MGKTPWSEALRVAGFAALVSGGAAAALSPDWATALKAQNYAGYVDLHLALDASAPVLEAGGTATVVATVYNGGPGDAHRARTFAALNGSPVSLATFGCSSDPSGYPLCVFAAPLPADGTVQQTLSITVPPQTRGAIGLSVVAQSDDPEAYPGQETAALFLPIVAHVDLQATVLCDSAYLRLGAPLTCHVVMQNTGTASAQSPLLSVSIYGGALANPQCTFGPAWLCPPQLPGNWRPYALGPGDRVEFAFTVTLPPDFPSDTWFVEAGAHAFGGETEMQPADNDSRRSYAVSLFGDGFDSN